MAELNKEYYAKTHEWVKSDGEFAYIGISEYAQEQMGDIVYVELPDIGDKFGKEENFAVIESVKAASEIYFPVSGEVVEINDEIEETPALLNENPIKNWLVKIKIDNSEEIDSLMDNAAYKAYCNEVK